MHKRLRRYAVPMFVTDSLVRVTISIYPISLLIPILCYLRLFSLFTSFSILLSCVGSWFINLLNFAFFYKRVVLNQHQSIKSVGGIHIVFPLTL